MLQSVDRLTIDKLHAAARRERSAYVHQLMQRAALWLRGLVVRNSLQAEPCCA